MKDVIEEQTFFVPIGAYEAVEHKIELLNRKARKFGCAEAVLEIINTKDFPLQIAREINGTIFSEIDPTRKVRKHEVSITCEPIKLSGWELIGALDRIRPELSSKENFTVLRPVPGKEIPIEYRDRDHCDHCNLRIARKTTYLVQHEDGRIKQVGGNCLRDFLGQDPEQILWYADWTTKLVGLLDDDFDGEFDNTIKASTVYDAIHFLEEVASVIRTDGWLSKGKAFDKGFLGGATADTAEYHYLIRYGYCIAPRDRDYVAPTITAEDKQQARDAFAWAQSISGDEKNEYLYGLHLVAKHECITSKQFGITASLIATYAKEQEKELKRQRFAFIKSEHVGEIKKRQEFEVECLSVRTFESDWGCTAQHRLLTTDNHLVVWWASESTAWLKEGEHYKVKATVKKHDEYEGKKQTIVNRVAVL